MRSEAPIFINSYVIKMLLLLKINPNLAFAGAEELPAPAARLIGEDLTQRRRGAKDAEEEEEGRKVT